MRGLKPHEKDTHMSQEPSGTPSTRSRRSVSERKRRRARLLTGGVIVALVVAVAAAAIYSRSLQRPPEGWDSFSDITPLGDPNAPVRVVMFCEFNNAACRGWHTAGYWSQFQEQFGDDIVFVYRHFPNDADPQSAKAAEAAQCAADQGAFWAYHDALMRDTEIGDLGNRTLRRLAADLALDTQTFNRCLSGGKYTDYVFDDKRVGEEGGVTQVPYVFVNGEPTDPNPIFVLAGIQIFLELETGGSAE